MLGAEFSSAVYDDDSRAARVNKRPEASLEKSRTPMIYARDH